MAKQTKKLSEQQVVTTINDNQQFVLTNNNGNVLRIGKNDVKTALSAGLRLATGAALVQDGDAVMLPLYKGGIEPTSVDETANGLIVASYSMDKGLSVNIGTGAGARNSGLYFSTAESHALKLKLAGDSGLKILTDESNYGLAINVGTGLDTSDGFLVVKIGTGLTTTGDKTIEIDIPKLKQLLGIA